MSEQETKTKSIVEFSLDGSKAKLLKVLSATLEKMFINHEPITWSFNKKNLVIWGQEGGMASFLVITIKKSFFDEYNVTDKLDIGLSVGDIARIFKKVFSDETIINFKFNNNTNKLEILFSHLSSRTDYHLNVHVPQKDEEGTIKKFQSIPLTTKLIFQGKGAFKSILNDLLIVAEKDLKYMELSLFDKKELAFTLMDKSMIGITVRSELKLGENSKLVEIQSDDKEELIRAQYDMENFENFFAVETLADKITVEYMTDQPMRYLLDLAEEQININYLVAPLETEEEEEE